MSDKQNCNAGQTFAASGLLAAARSLCERLRQIHDDPKYKAVWSLAYTHGDIYRDGPNYCAELETLESEVQKADNNRISSSVSAS